MSEMCHYFENIVEWRSKGYGEEERERGQPPFPFDVFCERVEYVRVILLLRVCVWSISIELEQRDAYVCI
jgi:hypothetical protein